MRGFIPAAAALTCALALYFTDSVLDYLVLEGNPVRVALVPGWHALAAFCAVGLLTLAALGPRSFPRTQRNASTRWPGATLAVPLFALILLVVPYLPVVPDWMPVLQILAGPLKWIVWLAVAGLFGWTVWQAGVIRVDWLARTTLGHATIVIGVLTALASGAAASRLAGTVIAPGGDEPHYLVIAQSLWRDGDLKIENNHGRGDYREYFPRELKPDYLTRGVDGEIYSIHPVGLPVLMAPIYGLSGYWGVVIALILCGAWAAALMWRWVVARTHAAGPATFGWAAIALTAPFLYNTFTVYPEIVAALAVVVAFTRAAESASHQTLWSSVSVGLACALLPWLSTSTRLCLQRSSPSHSHAYSRRPHLRHPRHPRHLRHLRHLREVPPLRASRARPPSSCRIWRRWRRGFGSSMRIGALPCPPLRTATSSKRA